MVGTIGHVILLFSFYPGKNLGAYGDAGAMATNDDRIATVCRMIANHGQEKKYIHKCIGINSRLDTLQASILDIKLKYFNSYLIARQAVAEEYDRQLGEITDIVIPYRDPASTHVFHQYTIKIANGRRDELKQFLDKAGIPTMIYYPIPLHKQEAFSSLGRVHGNLDVTEELCLSVLSLPMHTELSKEQQQYIIDTILSFYKG